MTDTTDIPPCRISGCVRVPIPHPYDPALCRPFDSHVIKPGPSSLMAAVGRINRAVGGLVVGVGPDAPTVTNEAGASQSDLPYHFHTGPIRALFAMAAVQKTGDAKYGAGNWRGIETDQHVNHALSHLLAWVAGDISDDHLVHALCRVAYAVEGEIDQKEGAPDDDSQ